MGGDYSPCTHERRGEKFPRRSPVTVELNDHLVLRLHQTLCDDGSRDNSSSPLLCIR